MAAVNPALLYYCWAFILIIRSKYNLLVITNPDLDNLC